MNLSVENIRQAVRQADEYMQANNADSRSRTWYCLFLESILLDYQKLYGEDTAFRLKCQRTRVRVSLTLCVACERANLLNSHKNLISERLTNRAERKPSWKYVRGENMITYAYPTPLTDFRSFRYIWRYMEDEKRTFIRAVLLRFLNMALSCAEPLLSAWIIVAYTGAEIQKIILAALLLLAQGALSSIVNYLASRMLRTSYDSMLRRMQTELAERILRIRTDCTDQSSTTVFTQRLLKDTSDVVERIDELLGAFTEAFRLVSLLIGFAVISRKMLVFEVILFTIYLLIQQGHSKRIQQDGRKNGITYEKHSGFVSEMIRAHRDIKVLHCEDSMMERISSSVQESVRMASSMRRRSMNFILLRSQFVSWTGCAYMMLLALLMAEYRMQPSTAVVLYNYNGKVYAAARDLAALMSTIYSLTLSTERIYQLMNSPDYMWEKFGDKHLSQVRGDVEMRDVRFSYRDADGKRNQVLKGISLTVHAGERVALVGRSGCGKTTILMLLSRLYDPDSGTILIDGVPTRSLDQDTLRGNMSMVSQSPYLFNMSVRDNLALARKNVTEEEMAEACRIACIHEDILGLPEGYDTVLGEGGIRLSGGQRQRLALARSLLQNAPIIMMDEATSALDNLTQSDIMQTVFGMKGNHTVIMVAHRLSTIIHCDRLFFISGGKVLASGTHQELLSGCSEYRELYGGETPA